MPIGLEFFFDVFLKKKLAKEKAEKEAVVAEKSEE